jgi:LuxR family maltose regulon positive regulatory protein
LIQGRPRLGVAAAWLLVLAGRVDDARSIIDTLRESDDEEVEAHLALMSGFASTLTGDADEAMKRAAEARASGISLDGPFQALLSYIIGTTLRNTGDLEGALAEASEVMRIGTERHNPWTLAVGRCDRALVLKLRGQLTAAMQEYREALAWAEDNGTRNFATLCKIDIGISDILREQDAISGAIEHLDIAFDNLAGWEVAPDWLLAHVTHARVLLSAGREEDACRALEQAKQWSRSQRVAPLLKALEQSVTVRSLIRAGRVNEAADITRGVVRAPLLIREMQTLSKASVLLAQDRPDEALSLINALIDGNTQAYPVTKLALSALALQGLGRGRDALGILGDALALASPQKMRRSFLDEGPTMISLIERGLQTQRWKGEAEAFAASLVVFDDQGLIEPLSAREIEVLSLVAAGLSNREIGERLFISTGTVKAHLHNILGKLAVGNRVQAVARARQLGLIRDPVRTP